MTKPLEAWSSDVRELTPSEAQLIAESGLVSVEVVEPPDTWRLTADSRVGVVSGEHWELRVIPRLAIPKLMFLLGYAVDARGWRDSVAEFGREADFFAAIASGFAFHAQRAIEPAPLRGYVTVDERSFALRDDLHVPANCGTPVRPTTRRRRR